jgi:hypothetical protein
MAMPPIVEPEDQLEDQIAPDLWAELLRSFPGEFVVIDDRHGQIVAHGHDARAVLQESGGKGVKLPILLRVPSGEPESLLL